MLFTTQHVFPSALLHNCAITLSTTGGQHYLPPSGAFDWHYMQCVIKRFGTEAYKAIPNVSFYELPFRTEDDDDDDIYEHDAGEPPYPSYRFDYFMSQQAERQALEERRDAIAGWVLTVPSGLHVSL
jgi:hypothetical protein